jgi:hypothetical protein
MLSPELAEVYAATAGDLRSVLDRLAAVVAKLPAPEDSGDVTGVTRYDVDDLVEMLDLLADAEVLANRIDD